MMRTACPLLALLLAACEGGDVGPAAPVEPAGNSELSSPADALETDAVDDAPASARFTLGTHYRRLSPTQPTSSSPDRVEVAALFAYALPDAYALEAALDRWRARLPGWISFVRIPVVRNDLERLHARAYYAAEQIGRADALHAALYRELHVVGNPLDSRGAIADVFARAGVPAAQFDAAFDAYEVHARVRRAEELTRRYRIDAAPAIVVNGKYTTTAALAGGPDALFALVDFLADAERSER